MTPAVSLRAQFAQDLDAWARRGWATRPVSRRAAAQLLFHHAGVRAAFLYRLGRWLHTRRVRGLPAIVTAMNNALHGLDVPPTVAIGGGLYLPHPVGTVITAESIGRDVEIQSGVTIGMRNTAEFPRIEDGAFLGTGCKVLGAVTIGRSARIGANAVVLHDVPPGATAVGVPARIIGDHE